MSSTWILALLAALALATLIALFLVRDLKLKKDVGRLLGELERLTHEKHEQQIQSLLKSRESISGALDREAGRLGTSLRETLQQNLAAIAESQRTLLQATEQSTGALSSRLTESQRSTRRRMSEEIQSNIAASTQRVIEHVQTSQAELQAAVEARLGEEFAAMSQLLLHKMGQERRAAIDAVFDRLEELRARDPRYDGICIDREWHTVDFGSLLQFEPGSHQLGREHARTLRSYLVHVLEIVDSPLAQKWLNSIAIAGQGDGHGTFLFNLNLSLQRSQRVLSILLSPTEAGERPLNGREIEVIQRLFAVNHHPAGSSAPSYGQIGLRFDFRLEAPLSSEQH